MEKKCFACDRKIRKSGGYVAHTLDGQNVSVGSECAKQVYICKGFEMGYQPPKGGPKIFFTMLGPCSCHNKI